MILKKISCKHTCTKKIPAHDDCGKQNFHARKSCTRQLRKTKLSRTSRKKRMRKNITHTYVPRKMRALFFLKKSRTFLPSKVKRSSLKFRLDSTIICGVLTNNTPYSRAFRASSILNSDVQDVFSSPPRINSSVAVDKVKLFLCIAVLS